MYFDYKGIYTKTKILYEPQIIFQVLCTSEHREKGLVSIKPGTTYQPSLYKPRHIRKQRCISGNHIADQCLCFRYIAQSLYFLKQKFQAFSHILWLYSLVCVTLKRGFLATMLILKKTSLLTVLFVDSLI